jgi:hypothetical protein
VALKLLDTGRTELGDGGSGEGPGLGLGFNMGRNTNGGIDGVVREGFCIVHAPAEDFPAGRIFRANGKGATLGGSYVLDEGAILAGQHETGEGGTDGVVGHGGGLLLMRREGLGCLEGESSRGDALRSSASGVRVELGG